MKLLYFSHPGFENLYPLRRRGTPVPLQSFLGSPVASVIARNALAAGLREVIVASPQAEKLVGHLPSGARAVEVDASSDPATELARLFEEHVEDFVLLQVGSFVASSEAYYSAISKWSETSSVLALLVPRVPGEEAAGPHSIKFQVNFERGVVESFGLGAVKGLPFSGIAVVDKSFANALRERGDLLLAVGSYLSSSKAPYHVWTGALSSVSTPLNLLEAVKEVLSSLKEAKVHEGAKVSPTAVIEGAVVVEEGAVIDHYSVIKGPAYIGRKAFVGAHSFVRSYTAVEPGAVVGAFSEIKRSYLGPFSTISSHCYITDSLVGDGALVRPFVVTLNYEPSEARSPVVKKRGSVIGEGAVVAGGSVLRPRSIVEPEAP